MRNKEAKDLLDKFRDGKLNKHEKAQLESWYFQEAKVSKSLADSDVMKTNLDEIWTNVSPIHKRYIGKPQHSFLWAAAITLIISSVGIYYYLNRSVKQNDSYALSGQQKIVPGQNRAYLILANGSKIDLTKAANGQVAKQAGLTISKTKAGQLIYTVAGSSAPGADAYNTIETPRGGQYQVHLPDGTRVWLNAASSLKYPLRFGSGDRKVTLTGEGYFEVAHDKSRPFKVSTAKQEVEVLGTHFDINAYADEPSVETTLLQGAVKVTPADGKTQVVLRPGQQSALKANGLKTLPADTAATVAWKNGYFRFNGDVEGILRQLARWYNVEIVYTDNQDPDLQFGGEISRAKDISSVLNIIEATGNIHFKIEGRRIVVMK